MAGFVVFLTLVLVARITAAPATNYANSYAENGNTAVVVVSNSSFGNGAFATNWRPSVHSRPETEVNLDSPTSCPPCPQGNRTPVSFSLSSGSGWITVENSTFGDGAFANHNFDKPIHVVNNQVLTGPVTEVLNSATTCPPCPQGNGVGESYGKNSASGSVVVENSKFGNGAFSKYVWARALYMLTYSDMSGI